MKQATHLLCNLIAATVLLGANFAGAGDTSETGFVFQDHPGNHLDVLDQGRLVARYMYAFDPSNGDRRHETYKPYLHIIDPETGKPITKGAGGRFSHHRGIFVGWKVRFDGSNYDFWHMGGVNQVHQEFLKRKTGSEQARLVSLVHWNGPDGKPILREERTMAFRALPEPGIVMVDVTTQLKAVRGDVQLDGDPEHSGVQYRPANEIVDDETVYYFPKDNADPREDRDYPWVGESYTVNDHRYSVVHMNHPDNPDGTIYSAYRDYGRFGAFSTHSLPQRETLSLDYRILIAKGEMPAEETIRLYYRDYAGDESRGVFELTGQGEKPWHTD